MTASAARVSPDFGALVISLDFELHWGVRDHAPPHGPYRANLLGVWDAVPRLLELFEDRGVAATWATVGMLMAVSRAEREQFLPPRRPRYLDERLDPYVEPVGEGELDDPLHFAPTLVESIRRATRQEIGTHTFSHFYCLEAGQTEVDFRADLAAAIAIARARGIEIRSIVFPRNQHNPQYDTALRDAGIDVFRGPARGWMHVPATRGIAEVTQRGARAFEELSPLTGARDIAWSALQTRSGLYNVRAGAFLRPVGSGGRMADALRFAGLSRAMRSAARSRRIFHLWWHPHNFGVKLGDNLEFLRRLLDVFRECQTTLGMRSMSMHEVARTAKAAGL